MSYLENFHLLLRPADSLEVTKQVEHIGHGMFHCDSKEINRSVKVLMQSLPFITFVVDQSLDLGLLSLQLIVVTISIL